VKPSGAIAAAAIFDIASGMIYSYENRRRSGQTDHHVEELVNATRLGVGA
jgi:hypothetical protein